MRLKEAIMDAVKMRRTVIRLAHEIAVDSAEYARLVLVGIGGRGEALAKEISAVVKAERGGKVPVGRVDISDDGTVGGKTGSVGCLASGAYVVTVNDVLRTGHTALAVNEALFEAGSPLKIAHAVLVDCSGGKSAVGARYVGAKVNVDDSDIVSVSVKDVDGTRRVDVYSVD